MGVHEVAQCDVCGAVVDVEQVLGWIIVKGFETPTMRSMVTMQGAEADKLVCSKACAHTAVDERER